MNYKDLNTTLVLVLTKTYIYQITLAKVYRDLVWTSLFCENSSGLQGLVIPR